jgi:ParB-like chromosome segregation protein Spo0J
MSRTHIAGKPISRSDLFGVDPYDIDVQEEFRGRHIPPAEEAIVEMAESLLEQGQIQPVLARKIEGGRIRLTVGFTRCAAARLIRDGFIGSDGQSHQDKEFKLQVKIIECNDERALLLNIRENNDRGGTSEIDDAHNQETLR